MLTKPLLYIFVILLTLGQLSGVSKSDGANIYLFDLISGIFAGYGLLYFLIVKKRLNANGYFLWLLGFIIICVFSLLRVSSNYNLGDISIASAYLVRLVTYYASALVVYNMLQSGLINKDRLFNLLIASGLLLVLLGIVQLIILPDFEVLDPKLGWDPHKNRLASTFFDPNFTGAYLVLCLALIFEKLYSLNDRKFLNYIILTILLMGIFLTFSRSAWVFFGIVVFIYGLFKSRALLFLAFLIVFGAYFAVPRVQTRISGITDPADSAHFRLISWSNSLKIVDDNLLFGVGYNTYRFVQKEYGFLDYDNINDNSGAGTDSSLLFVLATTGILGFIVFFGGASFYVYKTLVPGGNEVVTNPILTLSIIIGLLVESQFINSIFYPQIMFFWMIVLANCLSYKKH